MISSFPKPATTMLRPLRHLCYLTLLAVIPATGMSEEAKGSWLKLLRTTDLNDYALGVSLSVISNPYADSPENVLILPVLTSFNDPAFTDDWLIASDGIFGARWVAPSGFDLGLVSRLNTLGTGSSEGTQFRGVSERKWTLEAGPMVSYRRLPIHVSASAYYEILDRHSGYRTEARVSWPITIGPGWLVPSLDAIYQSEDYNNYYFGVDNANNQYRPRSDYNYKAGFSAGYPLSRLWLVTARVSYEQMGDEVTNSPLIADDGIWSATLGVAYNSDVFQPREGRTKYPKESTFSARVSGFYNSISSSFRRDGDNSVRGSNVDVDSQLSTSDQETVPLIDTLFRMGDYHRLELSYFELLQRAATTTTEDIRFGDLLIPAGTDVSTRFQSQSLVATYGYSLIKDAQKEVGVSAGLHYSRFGLDLQVAGGRADSARAQAPLPVLGAFGSVRLFNQWLVGAKMQLFAYSFDRYEGFLASADIRAERRITRHFSLGAGYTYYLANLASDADDLQGELLIRHHGPTLFLGFRF